MVYKYKKEGVSLFHVDKNSISNALKGVKKVIYDNEQNSKKDFKFESFKVKNHPHQLAAIDGSNHNINGTNLVFTTLRTGYLLYDKGILKETNIEPIQVEFILNNADQELGFEYKHEYYYHNITGELPSGRLEFDKVVERIRTLMEWEKVNSLIDKLDRNDIIIFDGSLISGEISTSHQYFSNLADRAKEKGIILVGLSKDTSLSMDSASMTSILKDSSKIYHPHKNWLVHYEDEGVYFVQFSKMKDLIFRIDAIIPDDLEMKDVVSWVGSYCFDTMLFGYPFPMQKIHDGVRISEAEKDYSFSLFKQECVRSGIGHEEFNRMFDIYHDKLDIKSFGR